MTTIYLVWTGSYSDASVRVAFTDEGIARALAERTVEGWVSETELDPEGTEELLGASIVWRARFGVDGSLVSWVPTFGDKGAADNYEITVMGGVEHVIYFRAVDRESARKAAPDRLARWLAMRVAPPAPSSRSDEGPGGGGDVHPVVRVELKL